MRKCDGPRTAVLASLSEVRRADALNVPADAMRYPLAGECALYLDKVVQPPGLIHGIQNIGPRRGPKGGVGDDYATGSFFGRPGFLPPVADTLAVVSGEAWAAGDADDGAPATFGGTACGSGRTSTRPFSAIFAAWRGWTWSLSPGRRVPECSNDASARTSIMNHLYEGGAAGTAPPSFAVDGPIRRSADRRSRPSRTQTGDTR